MNEFYVIYQQRNVRIVSFGSRTLVGAEANYHSSKFLAQKWAVWERFRDYLWYSPRFNYYTDFNPIAYLKRSSKVNDTGQMWINELGDFNFTVHYKPEEENIVVDQKMKYESISQWNNFS